MIISQVIEKYHKNRIISIEKMPKGIEKDLAIGALVADLGQYNKSPPNIIQSEVLINA